jgi:signal transduction histidine kinase
MAAQDSHGKITLGQPRRGPRVAFVLLVILFVSLATSIFFLIENTKERLRESTYDRGGLSGVQIQTHFERLMSNLVRYENGAPDATLDQVALEFDIVYERVHAHPNRSPNDQFTSPDFRALNLKLMAALEQWVPTIDRIAEGDETAFAGLRLGLEPLRPDVDRLAATTIQLAAELRGRIRADNIQVAEKVGWLIIGLAGLSLVFVLLVWRQYIGAERQRMELLDLTANLREANARVEAASRAKSEFLAHMSHELRTPLNSILGFSEVIRDGVMGKAQPASYAEYAGDIHTSSRHLLGLIDGLLDLSRIDAEQLDLDEKRLDLFPEIEWAVSLLSEPSQRASVTVILQDNAPGVQVLADGQRVRQMLLNLIDNAIKFSNPGGEVVIHTELTDQGEISITVRDNGRGIPREHLGNVLEPFHRGNAGAYHATEGAGLGLSIVRSLIESHGGTLSLESDGTSGTTARLVLPAHRVLNPRH